MRKATKKVIINTLALASAAAFVGGISGYVQRVKAPQTPTIPVENIDSTVIDGNDAPSTIQAEQVPTPTPLDTEKEEKEVVVDTSPTQTPDEPKEVSYSTEINDYTFSYANGVTTVTIEMNWGSRHSGENNDEEGNQEQITQNSEDTKFFLGNGIEISPKEETVVQDEETGISYLEETHEIVYTNKGSHIYLTGTGEIDDGAGSPVYFDPETRITYMKNSITKDGIPETVVVYAPRVTSPEETTFIMYGTEITGSDTTVRYDPEDGRLFIDGVEVTTPYISETAERELEGKDSDDYGTNETDNDELDIATILSQQSRYI